MAGRVPLAVTLMVTGLFTAGLALGQATGTEGATATEPTLARTLPASPPMLVVIPKLSVRAAVHPVGMDHTGAIAAPPLARADETGWYHYSPTPGQPGTAVIVGHVDDAEGPAVFHGLAELRPGDQIEVLRQDRVVTTFEVTDARSFDKAALPPEEVYGGSGDPELRLITCGGRWVGGQRGYADNLVVFARLVATR